MLRNNPYKTQHVICICILYYADCVFARFAFFKHQTVPWISRSFMTWKLIKQKTVNF